MTKKKRNGGIKTPVKIETFQQLADVTGIPAAKLRADADAGRVPKRAVAALGGRELWRNLVAARRCQPDK